MSVTANERYEKNLRIGVSFDGQTFKLLNGSVLPKLVTGSFAELVISPDAISEPSERATFLHEKTAMLLKSGDSVMVGVSPNMMADRYETGIISAEQLEVASPYCFLEVQLEQDLLLRIRGDQESRLSPCACIISATEARAESLNHAFTLISQLYETKRRSHSGNVFERAYARAQSERWCSLAELRSKAIASIGTP